METLAREAMSSSSSSFFPPSSYPSVSAVTDSKHCRSLPNFILTIDTVCWLKFDSLSAGHLGNRTDLTQRTATNLLVPHAAISAPELGGE